MLNIDEKNGFTAAGLASLQQSNPNLRIDWGGWYRHSVSWMVSLGGSVSVETDEIELTNIETPEVIPDPPYKRFEINTKDHVVSDDDLWWFGKIVGLTSLSIPQSTATDVGACLPFSFEVIEKATSLWQENHRCWYRQAAKIPAELQD